MTEVKNKDSLKKLKARVFKSTNPNTTMRVNFGSIKQNESGIGFTRFGEKFLEIPSDGIVTTCDPEIIYAIFNNGRKNFLDENGEVNEITEQMIIKKNKTTGEIISGIYNEDEIKEILKDIENGHYNFTPEESLEEIKFRQEQKIKRLEVEEKELEIEERTEKLEQKKKQRVNKGAN